MSHTSTPNQCPTLPEAQEELSALNNKLESLYQKLASNLELDEKIEGTISAINNDRHRNVLQQIKKLGEKKRKEIRLKLDVGLLEKEIEELEQKKNVSQAQVEHLQAVWDGLHKSNFKTE